MRRRCLAVLLALSPASALAADWTGIWAGDPAWCAEKDRIGEVSPAPVAFSATEIRGYESTCEVRAVEQIGSMPAWRLALTCTGEGMTDDDERILMLAEDGRLWEFDGIFEPWAMTRCD